MSSAVVLASLTVGAPAAFATEQDAPSTGSEPNQATPAESTEIPDGRSTDPVRVDSQGLDDAAKLAVSGTLGVVAVDGSPATVDEATGEVTPGTPPSQRYSVALADGTTVPVSGDLPASLTTGASFEGTVAIPDAVDAALPDAARGPVSESTRTPVEADSDAGADVLAAAAATEEALPIVEADIVPVAAQAAASSQPLLVAVVRPANSSVGQNYYTDTQVTTLANRLSTYWTGQSEGQISSIALNAPVKRFTSAYSGCSDAATTGMWNEALSAFGLGSDWQTAPYNGRHVIVITPDMGCDSIGLGTVGTVSSGGVLQTTVGIGLDLATAAHEFGHNLGLGHANTYECADPDYVEDMGDAGDCYVQQYGDIYDVMGYGYCNGSKCYDKPGALNLVDRLNLGFQDVPLYQLPSGQQSQTWTVQVSAQSSPLSPTRGAAVVDPVSGYYYTLEYRSGTGLDADSFYATQPATSQYRPGVRLGFSDDAAASYVQKVMPASSTPSFRSYALQQGDTFGSQAGGLSVAVSSIASGVATLTITATGVPTLAPALRGPRLTGSTSVGSTLSVVDNNWTLPGLTYSYAWQRNGVTIGGATSATYKLTEQDQGRSVTAVVTAMRDGYWSGVATTNAILVDAPPHQFTDVLPGDPFFAEIEWMADRGISTGYDNGDGTRSYHPVEDVSRQAMAAFLYRYSGETFTPPATPSFTDVPKDHPFYTAIEWMKARGISTGNADGTYAPLDPVTRQAMAAFLARLSGATMPTVTTPAFSDVPTSNPFAAQIQWMKDSGISTGYADGTFHPVEPVSRQAMAAFLFRYDKQS